jgi:Mg2+/Co2+ transporter CorB
LAAILTLNTIAHTVGAVGVGAQAAVVFGNRAVGVASVVMTLLVLVVSEIIPKTLGAVHAKFLALPAAMAIRVMILLCLPLIIVLERINRIVPYQRQDERLSRAELLATIRLGQASGAICRHEYQIASNLIALTAIRLGDVLTPRTVVFSLPEALTVQQVLAEYGPIRFARIPVYASDSEQVTGYVPRFAIHAAHSANEDHKSLKELAKPIPILPELATVGDALRTLIKNRQHIVLVVDEYGGMSGIATLEDMLETLLGEEIVDETDVVADMREMARRRMTQRQRRNSE